MNVKQMVIAVLRYLGNPAIFLAWWTLAADSMTVERVFGSPAFEELSTNVVRMNFVAFVACTAPVYLGVVGFYALLGRLVPRFSSTEFFRASFRPMSLLLTPPGLLNLWVWCSSGMEGNIMGFFFAMPLLAWTLFTFVYWCHSLVRGFGIPRGIAAV